MRITNKPYAMKKIFCKKIEQTDFIVYNLYSRGVNNIVYSSTVIDKEYIMKWIMLANSNDCRIYEYDRPHKHLALIEEISHPEHRLKSSEYWTTDAPGHYKSSGSRRGAFSEVDPVEQSIDEFARDIARHLDKGRNKHAYEDVTIIIPARMEGLLFKHMNKHTKELIKMIVQKNVVFMSDHELALYVEKLFSKSKKLH